jgi:hypothetical protein
MHTYIQITLSLPLLSLWEHPGLARPFTRSHSHFIIITTTVPTTCVALRCVVASPTHTSILIFPLNTSCFLSPPASACVFRVLSCTPFYVRSKVELKRKSSRIDMYAGSLAVSALLFASLRPWQKGRSSASTWVNIAAYKSDTERKWYSKRRRNGSEIKIVEQNCRK